MSVRTQRKGNPVCCWWKCKLVQQLWESVHRFLKNLKIGLLYKPIIPHLAFLKKAKTLIWKDVCTPIGKGNGNPLQYSCPKNPRDRAAWWAAVYGVAQSQIQLKQLSSSMHPYVHRSIIYNSQDMEATWMLINRWKDKEAVVCGMLFSHKKLNLAFATAWENLEGIMLNEISQSKTHYDFTSLWDLKSKRDEQQT